MAMSSGEGPAEAGQPNRTDPGDAGHNKRHRGDPGHDFWVAAICLAAVLPYLPTLTDYFVRDDFGVVQLLSSKPATWFPRWFVTSWMENIWGYLPDEVRPFPAVSYQITALWGAASPIAHHLLNIVLHAINGLLVRAIARTAADLSAPAAGIAAIAFVVLPVHVETVAWITGRVDSMPTLFYLGAFLGYVRWRAAGTRSAYGWSLLLFGMALFTKQNTITMVATLGLYDLIVLARPIRVSWAWLRPYVPFVLMTLAYLGLRFVLFGEVAREGQLAQTTLEELLRLNWRHLAHVVAGSVDAFPAAVVLTCAIAACLPAAIPPQAGERLRAVRLVAYFGPVWWLIGVLPIVVAGYESPRHVYLAAVGWAVLLGLAASTLGRVFRGRWGLVPAAAAAAVLIVYANGLRHAVGEYNEMSAVSRRATRALEREALAAPPGTLVLVSVPIRSWEWSLPFAAQPPYTSTDLTQRVFIVYPRMLHCCRSHWPASARHTLQAWARGPARDRVIVMGWDEETGAAWRTRSEENENVLVVARMLLDIRDPNALDVSIQRLVGQLGRR
jgi:hypothetical protein